MHDVEIGLFQIDPDELSPLMQLAERIFPENFLARIEAYMRERDELLRTLVATGQLNPQITSLPSNYVHDLMEKHGLIGALTPTAEVDKT